MLLASLALMAAHCASDEGATGAGGTGGSANDGAANAHDAAAPEWRDGEVDAGPNRSPLCGVIGCFPGNLSACGPSMSTEAGQYGGELTRDAAADGSARADAMAAADASRDATARSESGASVDASVRDAAVSESAAASDVAAGDPRADASPPQADPSEASVTDAAREGASADASGPSAATPDAAPTVDVSIAAADAAGAAIVDAQASADVSAVDAYAELADAPTVTDVATAAPAPPSMSCHIRPAATGVVTSCEPFGASGDGDLCNDSTDCEAALACVDVNAKAVCRPLRCAIPIACPPGTFYREAPLRAGGVTRADLLVPVCVPDDHCEVLAATNPCPAGEVCTVVGTAGETSCVVPGRAGLGDACGDANRCGDGLVCTKHKNTCVKLCHIGMGKDECMGGACEGGNNSLPDDIGVCVGEVTATE